MRAGNPTERREFVIASVFRPYVRLAGTERPFLPQILRSNSSLSRFNEALKPPPVNRLRPGHFWMAVYPAAKIDTTRHRDPPVQMGCTAVRVGCERPR